MKVIDNPARSRYELNLDGALAFINYRRQQGVVTLTHAEVPAHLNGRGIGSALVKGALERVRAQGEQVVPVCSFIRIYLHRHPEYADLLAK
jgi:predicted GNAT family acetyltransferase